MVNLQDYIAHSDQRLFKTLEIDELLLVKYQCVVDEDRSAIWSHNNYLAYVLSGEKKWKTQQCEVNVSRGEALFVKKGANTVYQYRQEPFLVLFVFLPDHFIRQVIARHPEVVRQDQKHPHSSAEDDSLIPLQVNNVLESFFYSLLTYFSQPRPPLKGLLRLKMEELLLNILSQPENEVLKQYFISLGRRQKVDIKTIMQTHFYYPLSIPDYARLCARSLSSFRRDFKRVYNTTPGQWLLEKRLEYSRFLLETTDKTIGEVMDESGFINRSHFIRVFKQQYGAPPKQYQALQLAG